MTIVLTKHPERQFGMGLSMSMGAGTPPTPYVPAVHIWTVSGETIDTFEDGVLPTKYYSGRTDIIKAYVDSGITSMGDRAFADCTSMSAITFAGSGTWYGHLCMGCTSLVNVSITGNYTQMQGWAFSGCTSLTSITIPDSFTIIGGYSFQDCSSLKEAVIGSGATTLGVQLFKNCTALSSITCYAPTAPTLNNANVFSNVAETGNLYIPSGATGYDVWLAALPEGWTIVEDGTEEEDLLADYVDVPAGMDWSAYFDYGGDLISESGASVEAVYFTLDSMVINVYDNNFIDAGSLGQYDIINNNGNCEWVLHSTGEAPEPESQEEEDMMTLNENFETSIFISGGAVYVRYKCTAGNVESVRFGGNGSGEGYYVDNNVLEEPEP